MADQALVDILKQGYMVWNKWREDHPEVIKPDLSKVDLSEVDLTLIDLRSANLCESNLRGAKLNTAFLNNADLQRADFSDTDFLNADLSGANISETKFENAYLQFANLSNVIGEHTLFIKADLSMAKLRNAKIYRSSFLQSFIGQADLSNANLIHSVFDFANLSGSDLSGADLRGASLQKALLVDVNIENALLTDCQIYGLSAWNIKGTPKEQSNLIITQLQHSEPKITVDDIRVAQFIHLLLNNKNIRNVIDTITSKAVLILGRFIEERKAVLEAIQNELRQRNYLPILFDFSGPASRDITETISTLAHLVKFVIADITDAKSIPQELQAIVPNLPSVPIQPIILSSQREYGMFEHFKRYRWVLETYQYESIASLISSLQENVIQPAENYIASQNR